MVFILGFDIHASVELRDTGLFHLNVVFCF
jgi:hypothetical protein